MVKNVQSVEIHRRGLQDRAGLPGWPPLHFNRVCFRNKESHRAILFRAAPSMQVLQCVR